MTRPFSSHDLHPSGASEPAALHSNHATKVKKSGRAQNEVFSIAQSSSPVSTGKRQPEERSGSSRRFHDILNTLSEYDSIIQNFEEQKQEIEHQRNEIIKLKNSQERIETLEKEKESLTKKVKKLEELSSKYKKHMNDVVTAQKFLKTEATKIMETSTQALELYASNGVYAGRAKGEAVTQKLKCAIEESKGLRVAVEKSASGMFYSCQLS
jgi:seryl-tRNA synthetase